MTTNPDQVKGKIKQAAGVLVGNEDLQHDGETQERAGKVKAAVKHMKDDADTAIDQAKDAVTKH